jgi:hypothetical protein
MEKYTLADIVNIINNIDQHKVEIKLGITTEKPYIGTWRGLPIELIGLKKGIVNTYNKIKP